MSEPQGSAINQELSIGDIFSRAFQIYRRYFVPNFVLFLVTGVIIGAVTTLASSLVNTNALAAGSTPSQLMSGLTGALEAALVTLIITVIIWPIAFGASIKLASDEITMGKPDLMPSVRFAVSRFLSTFVVLLITAIAIAIGLVLIIVPGIILAIMFCLAVPAVVLENKGIFESIGRSRQLVSKRWLKTFAFGIVLFIIIIIASVILGVISGLFGSASGFVSHVLSALYYPLIPISLTIYFYSNVARTAQPTMQQGSTIIAPGMPTAGTRYCPSCGAQLTGNPPFCPSCGAKQAY